MERRHWIMFVLLSSSYILQAAARPSDSELMTPHTEEDGISEDTNDKEDRGIKFYTDKEENIPENTRYILDNIAKINNQLTKPQREQINYNNIEKGGYALDEDVIQKLQQLIVNGKLQELSTNRDNNNNFEGNNLRNAFSRALQQTQFSQGLSTFQNEQQTASSPVGYMIANVPVLVPLTDNSLQSYGSYPTTRQRPPQLPFQLQWPLAPFFPILIKDPLLTYLHGGGFSNLFEYGQNADVCNRKRKSPIKTHTILTSDENNENEIETNFVSHRSSRQGRAISKRNIKHASTAQNVKPKTIKGTISLLSTKQKITKKKPVKSTYVENEYEDAKETQVNDGDLRHPFSDFGLFGNRKPVAPSPGFFINRLKVRRGGVAIAGPGGVATAGRGGTAIVGPGGLAYTQPGGMAVAGPAAKIYALSPETDLNQFVTKLHEQATNEDGTLNRSLISEGKLVATGFGARHKRDGGRRDRGINITSASLEPGKEFSQPRVRNSYTIHLRPIATAINGHGLALSNPVSNVLVRPNSYATVFHDPIATAVAGPGGIAHAQSNTSVQYLPFYGGAKGQYLEVTKDSSGITIKERIVSEDSISREQIVKNRDENLLSKVLTANLQKVQSLSNNLLILQNLGKKTGSLGKNDKAKFKEQLLSIGESSSNLVKLIDEIGEDIDILFKSMPAKKDEYEENVGEEGVGVDSSEESESDQSKTNYAEAKPVGLAVVGENGLAASRPIATAVAASGAAIARPIATAIAGVDPSALGITFQIHQTKLGDS